MRNLRVDGQRLWDSLMTMAEIGATGNGGCRRLALTPEDKAGRDLFADWCRQAGLSVSIDRMGNMFARRPGRDDGHPPVVTGSHLDTQPHGGRFDGVYGVLAGLEVVRTLNEHGIETDAPIEVAVWTNEEGARFAPAMLGSGVFAGAFDLDYGLSRADGDGVTLGEALNAIGYAGGAACGGRPFTAFFEAHIEQGPILEHEGQTIGVLSGVQGIRWYDVVVTGQDAHAGPTPMELRRDALVGAAAMVTALDGLARAHAPHGRATVGVIEAVPGSRNTLPGEVRFTADLRHPDADTLAAIDAAFRQTLAEIAASRRLGITIEEIWYSPPTPFDPDCVSAVRRATQALGICHMDMVSGAGHDAVYIARVAPTGMIFVPCEGGLSHNEAENADPVHLAEGASVLLHAMLDRAGCDAGAAG